MSAVDARAAAVEARRLADVAAEAARRARIAEAKANLKQVRAEAQVIKARLLEIRAELGECDRRIFSAERAWSLADQRLAQHNATKPDVLTPEHEMKRWKAKGDELFNEKVEAARCLREAEHAKAFPDQERMRLDARLEGLRASAANFEVIAGGGELGKWFQGGISGVS